MKRLLWGIVVLALFGAVFWMGADPRFFITHVDVLGTRYTSQSETEWLTAQFKHQHMAMALINWARKKKWIKDVPPIQDLSIRWTGIHRYQIKVTEKQPWVMLIAQPHPVFIAEDGTLLDPGDMYDVDAEKRILFRGLPLGLFNQGRLPASLVTQLHVIVGNLDHYFPDGGLQVAFDSSRELMLYKDDVIPIKMGPLTDLDQKFFNLNAYLQAMTDKELVLDYIDLRMVDRIVVRHGS